MITNFQIEKEIQKYNIKGFQGCYYRDALPTPLRQGSYIINLDSKNGEGGTHWCALLLRKNGLPIWFDSFGTPCPQEIYDRIGKNIWSNEILQDLESEYCGFYCIALLKYIQNELKERKTKIGYEKIIQKFINLFADDTAKNEDILKRLLANFEKS